MLFISRGGSTWRTKVLFVTFKSSLLTSADEDLEPSKTMGRAFFTSPTFFSVCCTKSVSALAVAAGAADPSSMKTFTTANSHTREKSTAKILSTAQSHGGLDSPPPGLKTLADCGVPRDKGAPRGVFMAPSPKLPQYLRPQQHPWSKSFLRPKTRLAGGELGP